MNTIFADRVGNITIASGVARLDFLTLKELDTQTQKAELEPVVRLTMPIEGIMQTIEALDKMKADLIAQAQQQSISNEKVPTV